MISEDDVRYVANLARLLLEEDESRRIAGELGAILSHIDKMSELDISGVPPTAHVLDLVNVMRADRPQASLSRAEVLRNAPAVSDECFRVPRMG